MEELKKHWLELATFFCGLLVAFVTMRVNVDNLTNWIKSLSKKNDLLQEKIIELEKTNSAQHQINRNVEDGISEIKEGMKNIYGLIIDRMPKPKIPNQ